MQEKVYSNSSNGSNSSSSNRYFIAVFLLLAILLFLQYKIFIGKNNIFFVLNLKKQINVKNKELEKLRNKNNKLALKIDFLKHNPLAYEEQARYELGMQKPSEIYYQVIVPVN